jgi:hypothetical protein
MPNDEFTVTCPWWLRKGQVFDGMIC